MTVPDTLISSLSPAELTGTLGFDLEIGRVKDHLREWIERSDQEVREPLEWQFFGNSKYFRPATIFACHRALIDRKSSERVIRSAVALELVHNVSLIIDDILDRSRYRRDRLTLHCRFGSLPALMTAGYITSSAYEMVRTDPYAIEMVSSLFRRLGVAECLQWRLRRHPLGVEDWRAIAGEDTGSMFETCACLGTRSESLRAYGRLLGILYHGCDDVGDVRGASGLGGGGDEDFRDGILTLPLALAIRNPAIAVHFRNPTANGDKALFEAMVGALPAAERYLDGVTDQAIKEASTAARHPAVLHNLVRLTRVLSRS
jgi:geranylgeranyl pyrophosphate synthase